MRIRRWIPGPVKSLLRPVVNLLRKDPKDRRAIITEPTGKLRPGDGPMTFVTAVGHRFDQNRPDAALTCRVGLCRAFEQLGIPYVFVDVRDLAKVLPSLPNPFCWISGADFGPIRRSTVRLLRKYPLFVWVDPWFKNSNAFFSKHRLDGNRWTWSEERRRKILDSEPRFVHFADVASRLRFFQEWDARGLRVVPLPLACDTALYNASAPYRPEFDGVRMAFVGGYWPSKARQLDKYLRPFEEELTIYGYTEWPYSGYRGLLSDKAEPSLYRQALLCPTINEPHASIFVGTNERVFKILGCGGATVVDAVPAYRELFTEDELPIPKDEKDFVNITWELLRNSDRRAIYSRRGYEAVRSRHTYISRAKTIMKELGLGG